MFTQEHTAIYKYLFELERVYMDTGTGLAYLNHVPCDGVLVEVEGWWEWEQLMLWLSRDNLVQQE